jgi:two-component system LytT family response regulator
MSTIRTVIADDQPITRERLASLLQEQPDVEVVASCSSGAEAVRAIEAYRPDLVFLDMQMPELDGFGVIDAVGPAKMPSVVFVTGYDELALRAFDIHALDYLLKPFGRQRFQKALERAREHVTRGRGSELASRLVALVEEVRPIRRATERIVVRSGSRVVFVELHNVDWVEAEGNYVRLHVGEESHLIRETMHAIEQRLGERFLRIHRSRIVNVGRVRELRLVHNGEYEVVMRTGRALRVSRLFRERLSERLKHIQHAAAGN